VSGRDFRGWIGRAAILVGLTILCYLPYVQNYAAGYSSVQMWRGSLTPFRTYLWIHGIFLFPLLTRIAIELWRRWKYSGRPSTAWHLSILIAGALLVAGGVAILCRNGTDQYPAGTYEVAWIAMPIGICAASLLLVPAPMMPNGRRLLWFMVGTAMALSLAVEIIVLKGDIGRMNTVFKFYLQVWTLLAVAAGVSLAWVSEHTRRWRRDAVFAPLWWGGMAALILGGALFLPYGVRARAIDRMSPYTGYTLDGMAFMETSTIFDGPTESEGQEISLAGDYAAIRWMQANIPGSPVILEGVGRREYLWGNRISIYTGLPAVVGWRWHQVQQYATLPSVIVDWRREDVRECYNTTDISQAEVILDRYGVRYIYVGEYERAYYTPAGLAKFDRMVEQGRLHLVYDAQGVCIYQVAAGG
jgi:uncharacterized membrane protein